MSLFAGIANRNTEQEGEVNKETNLALSCNSPLFADQPLVSQAKITEEGWLEPADAASATTCGFSWLCHSCTEWI